MSYFRVTAKCGHAGKGKYCLKTFYVEAKNKKDAEEQVRKRPRVKHDRKDAITDIHRIDYEAYIKGLESQKYDPFFKCNSEEDRQRFMDNGYKFNAIKQYGRFDGKSHIKNPKKYIKFYDMDGSK